MFYRIFHISKAVGMTIGRTTEMTFGIRLRREFQETADKKKIAGGENQVLEDLKPLDFCFKQLKIPKSFFMSHWKCTAS